MNQYRQNRGLLELRPVKIETGIQSYAAASVFWTQGETKVLAAVSAENKVPSFLEETGSGWLTAEYAMLPAATRSRTKREAAVGKQTGRTVEIQRLIGRSLRQAVDLEKMGEITLKIDCEVIQADGGTRTASISAAYLAVAMAVQKLGLDPAVLKNEIGAVSVGIVGGEISLDLDYDEDSHAEVDMNVIMTGEGNFVEVQGTGEKGNFDRKALNAMLAAAESGIYTLLAKGREIIK